MQITVNGETTRLDKPQTIGDFVESLSLDMRKIAIERNLSIVPRESYSSVTLEEGDQLEIVHFIGGG